MPSEIKTEWECPFCSGIDGHSGRCSLRHRETAPAAPTVHLNGTAWVDLYSQYENATRAVDDAITKLCAAAPNGRDYYVQQESGAAARAQDEHHDRITRLKGVKAELEAIWMAVSDQEGKR